MAACLELVVDNHSNFASDHVEYGELYCRRLRKPKCDLRRRVEWIGIVLLDEYVAVHTILDLDRKTVRYRLLLRKADRGTAIIELDVAIELGEFFVHLIAASRDDRLPAFGRLHAVLGIDGQRFFEGPEAANTTFEPKLLDTQLARRAPPNTNLRFRCQIRRQHDRIELYRRGRLRDRGAAIDHEEDRHRHRHTRTPHVAEIIEVKDGERVPQRVARGRCHRFIEFAWFAHGTAEHPKLIDREVILFR